MTTENNYGGNEQRKAATEGYPIVTVPTADSPSAPASFYVVSGTLPLESGSYVERQADKDLVAALLAGEYCFVLNSRQMGKSSLCVRTMARLKDAGVTTVFLDLTAIGGANVTPDQWYMGLLSQAGRELGLRGEFIAYAKANAEYSAVQRFLGAVREVGLEKVPARIVIFIDEIDAVRSLKFPTDEFFAAIRACYNERTQDAEYRRLTFCLVGSATTSDLIADTRTSPFNIGKRIELKDFTAEETLPLSQGIAKPNASALVERAFYWTNGHPFLTQALCAEIAQDSTAQTPADVDRLVASVFFEAKARERNVNLADVSNRILSSYLDSDQKEEHRAAILDLYKKVLSKRERVTDDETSRLVSVLKLSGITRSVNGELKVRNRIYERVFDKVWIAASMPDAEKRRQQAAYRAGLIRAIAVSAGVVLLMSALALFGFTNAQKARTEADRAGKAEDAAKKNAEALSRNLYFANMNVIQADYEKNNFGRLRQLLDETRDNKERGFEWDYWNRAANQASITLKPGGPVFSAVYSSDGKKILTASEDKTATVWDARTGQALLRLVEHTAGVICASFSPDDRYIVTASMDRTAKVWDASTGKVVTTFYGAQGKLWFAYFSPSGQHVVTSGEVKAARVWDAFTGKEVLSLSGHKGKVTFATFSPDGNSIVTGGADATAKLWDARTGKEIRSFPTRGRISTTAALSPDGSRIVTLGESTAIIWDVRTGRELLQLKRSSSGIMCGIFAPDGRMVAIADDDGIVVLWDAQTGQKIRSLRGHGAALQSVAFSPDGQKVLTASLDGTAKVWDAQGREDDLVLKGHAGWVRSVAFSPDGSRILSSDNTNTFKVWDAFTGKAERTIQGAAARLKSSEDPNAEPTVVGLNVAFSPDGKRIATGIHDKAIVWDAATGKQLIALDGHRGVVSSVTFSPNGDKIVTGSKDKTAKVWDAATGRILLTLAGHSDNVGSVAFSPDGMRVLTGGWDNSAKLWDGATGKELLSLNGHGYDVFSVAFSPDGERIVTSSAEITRVWDAESGRGLLTLRGHTQEVYSVSFSPDGKRILTASWDRTAKLWDGATGREVLTLQSTAGIPCATFSPDGKRIAVSESLNQVIKIWSSDGNVTVISEGADAVAPDPLRTKPQL